MDHPLSEKPFYLVVLTVDGMKSGGAQYGSTSTQEHLMSILKIKATSRRITHTSGLLLLALLVSACSTEINPEQRGVSSAKNVPDPPCTVAGYFKSNEPGKYYQCIYSSAQGRWLKKLFHVLQGKTLMKSRKSANSTSHSVIPPLNLHPHRWCCGDGRFVSRAVLTQTR